MSRAHDALHIVFNLHAGFLQSYEADERKRMLKCYHIVCDTEDDLSDLCGRDALSDSQLDASALQLLRESLDVLLRLASTYVAAPMRQIPTDLDAAGRGVCSLPRRTLESEWWIPSQTVSDTPWNCSMGALSLVSMVHHPGLRSVIRICAKSGVAYGTVLRDIYWVWQTGDDAADWVLDILQRTP